MARINVLNVFPELGEGCGYGYSYEAMVEAFGRRVLVAVDVADWQGDSYRLIADGDEPGQRYGLLVFGWGSCSGCDALQACESIEDYQALLDRLQDSVQWYSDKEALKRYMQEHDWEGDWSWHREESHEFRQKVMEFLESDQV